MMEQLQVREQVRRREKRNNEQNVELRQKDFYLFICILLNMITQKSSFVIFFPLLFVAYVLESSCLVPCFVFLVYFVLYCLALHCIVWYCILSCDLGKYWIGLNWIRQVTVFCSICQVILKFGCLTDTHTHTHAHTHIHTHIYPYCPYLFILLLYHFIIFSPGYGINSGSSPGSAHSTSASGGSHGKHK